MFIKQFVKDIREGGALIPRTYLALKVSLVIFALLVLVIVGMVIHGI